MKLLLDKIAIWKPTPVNELTCRPIPKGMRYYDGEEIKHLPKTGYRYAKNYEGFSLVVFTLEEDAEKVEELLDNTAKNENLPKPSDELTYLEDK